MNPTTLTIDIGNSSIKWGIFHAGKLVGKYTTPNDSSPNEALTTVFNKLSELPKKIILASVVPASADQFSKAISEANIPLVAVNKYSQIPMPVQLKEPEKAGIDRLLSAYAGLQLATEFSHVITVDAGTAITVDLSSKEEGFLGGAILPGYNLLALSLHEKTALLPLATLDDWEKTAPGKTTVESIQLGISAAASGGVASLIEKYQALSGPGSKVFFTGGNGLFLANELNRKDDYYPDMVLWALYFLSTS